MELPALRAASIVKGGTAGRNGVPCGNRPIGVICVSYGRDRCFSFTLLSVPRFFGGANCACVRVRAHRVCCSGVSFGGARVFVFPYVSIRKEDVACDTCGGAISGAPLRWGFLCVASMQRRTLFCRRFRETCSSVFPLDLLRVRVLMVNARCVCFRNISCSTGTTVM